MYRAYKNIWTPVLRESLLVKHEPTNTKDSNAVAVCLETTISKAYPSLRWDVNKAFAEVTHQGRRLWNGGRYCASTDWPQALQIVDASGHL